MGIRPRPWDVAAGALIVAEAGGRVTNLMLASNGKLHRAMPETVAKAWPEADRQQAKGRAAHNTPFPLATSNQDSLAVGAQISDAHRMR